MKTILLPTDFSENSLNAIHYAMFLFKTLKCDFYLLNVHKASSFITDDILVTSPSTTIYKTILDASKKSITKIITEIKTVYNNENHSFHSVVDYDNFIEAINQISKKHNVDLIVMGTKGASGLEKVVFGSNTVHVIQRCSAPVLAIPSKCKYKVLKKIAFTNNDLALYKTEELKILKNILVLNNSKLEVLHHKYEDHMKVQEDGNINFLNSYFINATHRYIDMHHKNVFKTIQRYIKENNIGMLSMVSKKHSFLERLFNRHIVETYALNIDIPFLVMKKNEIQV